MTKRIVVLLAVLALFAASCSEAADDDAESVSTEETEEAAVEVASPEPDNDADNSTDDSAEPEPEAAPTEEPETAPTEEAAGDAVESEPEPESPDPGDDDGDGSIVAARAGQSWFLGEIPASATAADPSLEPVRVGMINQENTPLGSFPEVRAAAQAATAFINAELGGVDGRPVELIPCITSFDVEQSQSCAQELVQEGVVAFVGGVDITSNGSFPVIEQNDLALVGGVPAGLVEQQSPNAFFFSGGGAGGAAAFMQHAVDNGATKVLLAYGEFESFEVAARDYAAVVGESLGLEVELLSFSLFATDYLPVLTKAKDVGADAIIVLAADAACLPVMQNMVDLEIDAQLYLTGACAAEAIIDAAGDNILGVLFNSEGPVEEGDPEGDLYAAAIDQYATEPAGGVGTVGFRGMMNLYALLLEVGGDNLTPESILAAVQSGADRPSFWGHPYTCDGQQVPGLPALCAPQQILFQVPDAGGVPAGVGDWIDTAELFQVVDG